MGAWGRRGGCRGRRAERLQDRVGSGVGTGL